MNLYKEKFNEDFKYGISKENELKPIIESRFDIKLTKASKFHNFDFLCESTKTLYEIKSRKNNHNTYPTTMIGYNKLDFIKFKQEKTYKHFVFMFNFIDGLYYIKYNKKLFDTFEVKIGGRRDRNKDELKDYLYIPIQYLVKIE